MTTIDALASELVGSYPPGFGLWLDIGGVTVHVRTNSEPLLAELARYFSDRVVPSAPTRDIRIIVLEAEPPRFPMEMRDWPREAGKLGEKERYADTRDGRVVRKTRTGMQFLLARDELVAVGPALANLNQVINFIISQYLARRLGEGWVGCHAAGVALAGRGLGIAARSGAGKSTLALHLVSSGLSFVSNDRLLLERTRALTVMAGVPKMPRVNPGTLLHNPDLIGLLPAARREALAGLPDGELWRLEEKYDVMIPELYGRNRCLYRMPMAALLVLGWSHSAREPARFDRVALGERPDLLELVMKSPGVFHRDREGRNAAESDRFEPEHYLRALAGVPVYEATGRVEFEMGVGFCRRLLES